MADYWGEDLNGGWHTRRKYQERDLTYHIRVIGQIPESWEQRMGGLSITRVEHVDGQVITTLEGKLDCKTCLADVFSALQELGVKVFFSGGYYVEE